MLLSLRKHEIWLQPICRKHASGFHNLCFSLRQETVVFKGLPFHNKPTITISGG